ncbi:hypothetical protein PHLGIDRAFT_127367 [Phlebiopsis gigantea 11061_1 CR5-6]|uniref:Protein kinase domain-containing protein n=1 Tax=Phlebiopsis gigantea (strain 11061_1 CR5-6) TaxID=745531 RepID=A0A0C3NRY2_PHLG1|nr:hypothetical protein PHLGIDRAFT_127367 [Phlebiopsis gigantea 11061_1 CR5-6]
MSNISPSVREQLRANNAKIGARGATLLPDEELWRDKFHFLAAQGYTLRPRYHPDWKPSWEADPDIYPVRREDYFASSRGGLIDATRKVDGRLVCIKKVKNGSEELKIATLFSQSPLRDDPRNHCVPILETFPDPHLNDDAYIVMPFLRLMDDPPFQTVGEVVDFADQMIEGLAFMHENYVAHRDCAPSNLFFDAEPMYPQGFHPVINNKTPDLASPAPFYSRSEVSKPIKYYIADFDLSSYLPPGKPRRTLGRDGADQEVPELSDEIPYDPFQVDVFILGNALRRKLYDKYYRLDFFRPLILSMTKKDPEDRPSAEGALKQWQSIRKHITAFQRVCRLRGRDEGIVTSLVWDVLSMFKPILGLPSTSTLSRMSTLTAT